MAELVKLFPREVEDYIFARLHRYWECGEVGLLHVHDTREAAERCILRRVMAMEWGDIATYIAHNLR
jgi:hypothetical protein